MNPDGLYKQFQVVFEKYYNPLCKYAAGLLKNRDTAEDVVQNVFALIWQNRKDLIATDKIRFYLFTAVRNNCITHINQEKRIPTYSLSDHDTEDEDYYSSVDTADTDREEWINYKALLEKGIGQLPPKCREVFLLSKRGDMSNEAVASTLGISVKTVNNQLWKALKILRQLARQINTF